MSGVKFLSLTDVTWICWVTLTYPPLSFNPFPSPVSFSYLPITIHSPPYSHLHFTPFPFHFPSFLTALPLFVYSVYFLCIFTSLLIFSFPSFLLHFSFPPSPLLHLSSFPHLIPFTFSFTSFFIALYLSVPSLHSSFISISYSSHCFAPLHILHHFILVDSASVV